MNWLMDAYRSGNKLVLWIKTRDEDIRLEKYYRTNIYMEASKEAKKFLDKEKIKYYEVKKKTYLREIKKVYSISTSISNYEGFVSLIEKKTRYRIPLYNADIAPEQEYLFKNDLRPCSPVNGESPVLKSIRIKVNSREDIRTNINSEISSIKIDKKLIRGSELEILKEFVKLFEAINPDVVIMRYAFSRLPYLVDRLEKNNLHCKFHRWDERKIKYKGGKSFWSYGIVHYRDFAVRLNGRFLVDTTTYIGDTCNVDAIMELCQLSGVRFQQIASRSFGAVFQGSLVREMIQQGMLVPFKEKPIDPPLNMLELLKADRVGHVFDPKVGFHKDVAEIDFSSLYPWLIYNRNISADTILSDKGPFEKVPELPIKISLAHKGLVPLAIKPMLDRRMYYKNNPSAVNKERAIGLKWVLVTSYGYLRFREFKLGIAQAHMAIGAYARELLLMSMKLAEERGFEVVHGIIDSLYIKKKNISDKEVKEFCSELEMLTGIPVSFEGIFKWLVFLPSIIDSDRPVPSRYYGVFKSGDLKVRGIEMRQRSSPFIVQLFQRKILDIMKECDDVKEIKKRVPYFCRSLRRVIKELPRLKGEWLSCQIRIAKTEYKNNIPQKL